MSDAADQQAEKPLNLTRAGVMGKVPQIALKRPRRGGRKPVRMSGSQKKHAKQLAKQGVISQRAAADNGIKAAK